jgi:mevalonate kinase
MKSEFDSCMSITYKNFIIYNLEDCYGCFRFEQNSKGKAKKVLVGYYSHFKPMIREITRVYLSSQKETITLEEFVDRYRAVNEEIKQVIKTTNLCQNLEKNLKY